VRGTLDEITAQLDHAEDEARVAAEAAHHRVVNTPPDDSDLEALAAAGATDVVQPAPEPAPAPEPQPEIEAPAVPEPDAWALPEPPVTAAPPSVSVNVPMPEAPAEPPRPSLVRLQPFDEEEGVRIIGPVSEAEPTQGPEPATEQPAVEEQPAAEEQHEGSVDDLFARLRADRQGAVIKAQRVLAQREEVGPETPMPVAEEHDEVDPDVVDEGVGEEGAGEEAGAADADRRLLEQRDECLEPVAGELVRKLKRVLQDEQNEILDRLRQSRGRGRPDDALPTPGDQAGRYRDAAVMPLTEGARIGASFNGGGDVDVPAGQWAQDLADELVSGLRDRISRSLAAVGESAEESDAADSLGAAYRQWKTERVEQIARHHLAVAFNGGILAAEPAGSALRWVFGDSGPCPDCDDNALAGPTAKGEAYPTGQPHPPAHAGCGCLLVAVDG
jgi:hypothetical protein